MKDTKNLNFGLFCFGSFGSQLQQPDMTNNVLPLPKVIPTVTNNVLPLPKVMPSVHGACDISVICQSGPNTTVYFHPPPPPPPPPPPKHPLRDIDAAVGLVLMSGMSHKSGSKHISRHFCHWNNCGQVFPSAKQLHMHVEADHIRRLPYHNGCCGWQGCSYALRKRSCRRDMKTHVAKHSKYRKFKCTKCSQRFSDTSNRHKHMKIHDTAYM